MTAKNRDQLRLLFENSDIPTESGFQDLFDSYLSLIDQTSQSVASPVTFGGITTFSGNVTFTSAVTYSQTVNYSNDVTFNSSATFQGNLRLAVDASASATGTSQGTALILGSQINVISGGTAAQGVLAPLRIGTEYSLYNRTTNSVFLYPATGVAINGLPANSPFTLSASVAVQFFYTEATRAFTLKATT